MSWKRQNKIRLEKVVAAAWRLSRISKIEPLLIKLATQNSWSGKDLTEIFDNYLGRRLALMSRYEITLERALFKALNELKSLQETRKNSFNSNGGLLKFWSDMKENKFALQSDYKIKSEKIL